VKKIVREVEPATVPARAKQTGEVQGPWAWVERAVWTDRMLDTLGMGVKGGVWFSLIEKVYRPKVLFAAWLSVRGKERTVGSDHQRQEQFEQRLETNLARLEAELRTGTYRPRPIRRLYIDKPASKVKRTLGIPTVPYASPHEVKPPTEEPDAGDPLVRFGGGKRLGNQSFPPL
jgi:RNA-directed DNA polymerase